MKKSVKRHKLLRHKLSMSEGESGDGKEEGKKKKKRKEGKKKSRSTCKAKYLIYLFVLFPSLKHLPDVFVLLFQLTVMTPQTQTLKSQTPVQDQP